MIMMPAPYSKRFLITLAVSCLAHAALVLTPAPGAGKRVTRPAPVDGLNMGRSRPLDVTLVRERKSVVTIVVREGVSTVAVLKEREPAATIAQTPPPSSPPANLPVQPSSEEKQRLAPAPGTLIPPLPIPAPTFYTTDQLTKRPELISDPPKLEVTEAMPAFGSGKVILKVWINELGAVVSVDLDESDVPESVADAALAAFAKLRFEPGEINGRPVATLMRIEVSYDEDLAQP